MNKLVITSKNMAKYENKSLVFDGSVEIEHGLGIVKFASISATGSLVAMSGCGIEAGCGIKAGDGIEAGCGIKAGDGIEAGFSIRANFISVGLRIFAGLVSWRLPTEEEMLIDAKIRSGTVAHGVIGKITELE